MFLYHLVTKLYVFNGFFFTGKFVVKHWVPRPPVQEVAWLRQMLRVGPERLGRYFSDS